MGAQIFLKSGKNKAGKRRLFIYMIFSQKNDNLNVKNLKKTLVYQSILKIGIRKHIK